VRATLTTWAKAVLPLELLQERDDLPLQLRSRRIAATFRPWGRCRWWTGAD